MALSCGLLAAQKLHKTCTNCTELLCSAPHPLHLYPESPQKLHPNVQLNAPEPRINSRIFFLVKAKGNNKDRFAHHLKVANRSIFVAQTSPARCVSEREKGGDFALRESRTVGSGAPLVTFPATGKSPGDGGAERPPHGGECRGGAAPSQRINRGSCSRPSCARTCPKSACACGYSAGSPRSAHRRR